jgi:hypothetical protein
MVFQEGSFDLLPLVVHDAAGFQKLPKVVTLAAHALDKSAEAAMAVPSLTAIPGVGFGPFAARRGT